MNIFTIITVCCAIFLSCARTSPSPLLDDPWEKARWIEKAAGLLSADLAAVSPEEMAAWTELSDSEILDRLMERPEFPIAIADFNLYFLGFKPDNIYVRNGAEQYFAAELFAKPQALNAALALSEGGDYKKQLLAVDQQAYLPMIHDPYIEGPEYEGLTPVEKRALMAAKAKAGVDRAMPLFEGEEGFDKEAGCQAIFGDEDINNLFFQIGASENLAFKTFWAFLHYVQEVCYFQNNTDEDIKTGILELKTIFAKLLEKFEEAAAANYPMATFADLKPFALTDVGLPDTQNRFTEDGFWKELENSSTNFNRRRGAYMLKTYFCDDLTPLNVALPDEHVGDAHATDPGCQACHYKLDPMAGFFRHYGQQGYDFTEHPYLLFDDGAFYSEEPYQNYIDSWKFPEDGPELWNVGYIRSAKNPDKNDYGTTPADLMAIIAKAEEADRCLVQRLAEYLIGPNQVLDGGWLEHLTDEFRGATNSSQGVKRVIRQMVQSNAVRETNPDNEQCYDFAPGSGPGDIPCRVSFILKQNCKSCHNSGSRNGLNLNHWSENEFGEMTFPHVDSEGHTLSKAETFTRILERLSTGDPEKLMPKNRDMDNTHRANLYLWIDQILSEL